MVHTFATTLLPAPVRPVDGAISLGPQVYRGVLRLLAETLIVTLFLLSAITFSTETIPNFQPDCEVSHARKAAMLHCIKIVLPRILMPSRRGKILAVSYSRTPPLCPSPRTAFICTPSRAPPPPLF